MKYSIAFILLSSSFLLRAQDNSFKKADSLFSLNEWEKAIVMYKKAMQINPLDPIALSRIGYCYYQTGKLSDAKKNYIASLNNKPGNLLKPIVKFRLAKIYIKENQPAKAFEWLDSAFSCGYLNVNELMSDPDFRSVQKNQRFTEIHEKMYKKAYPCSTNSKHREFDFWIGEWNVFQSGTTNLVGHSKVQNTSGDCTLLESWTSATGPYTGKSLNFYNESSEKWEQHWIGSMADIGINNSGVYSEGAMRFNKDTQNPDGSMTLTHFNFHNLPNGQVRQHLENSTDNGKTWQTAFDFTYVRKKQD